MLRTKLLMAGIARSNPAYRRKAPAPSWISPFVLGLMVGMLIGFGCAFA